MVTGKTSTEEISVGILMNSRLQSCMYTVCYVWALSYEDYPALEVYVTFSISHSPSVELRRIDVHTPICP